MNDIDMGWIIWSALTLPISGVVLVALLLLAVDNQWSLHARRALLGTVGLLLVWSAPGLYVLCR